MKAFSVNVNGITARVKVEPSATGPVWRYRFRSPVGRAGRQYKGTIGDARLLTVAMARKMMLDRIGEVMSGPPAPKILCGAAIEQYMKRHGCRLARDGQKEKAVLERFAAFTGDRPLDDISTGLIEDYRAMRLRAVSPPTTEPSHPPAATRSTKRKAASPSTVNREMTVIKSFWNKAILWGLCKSNPTKGMKKLREAPGRVRYLVEDEWPRLEKAAKAGPWWLYPAVALARYVGLRQGEILRLNWSDADMGNALVRVRNTKANRHEVIPLSKPVVELLWGLRREGEHILFNDAGRPIGKQMLIRAWWQALEAAEITDLRFHDLRHDFGSRVTMAKGIEAARVLLRHTDYRMTERYAHLSPGYLRDAVEAVGSAETPSDSPSPVRPKWSPESVEPENM